MLTARTARKCRTAARVALLMPLAALAAPAMLEVPAAGQPVSGVGLVSGWACDARRIEASIDGSAPFVLPIGSSRADTAGACGGREGQGFGFLIGWNNLPPGQHTLRVTADGVEFARTPFVVVDVGNQRITGVPPASVAEFPRPGQSAVLQWQEASQSFAVAEVRAGAALDGRWNGADLERRSGCRAPQNDGNHGTYAQYEIDTANGQFAIRESGVTGLTCSYAGTSTRDRAGLHATGTYSCNDGKSGRFTLREAMVREREMSLQLDVRLEGTETCTIDKTLGGSRY